MQGDQTYDATKNAANNYLFFRAFSEIIWHIFYQAVTITTFYDQFLFS